MSKKLMLFSASWCQACQTIKPKLEGVEGAEVISLDDNLDVASKYNIKSIPALVVLEGDTEVARGVGKYAVLEVLKQHG